MGRAYFSNGEQQVDRKNYGLASEKWERGQGGDNQPDGATASVRHTGPLEQRESETDRLTNRQTNRQRSGSDLVGYILRWTDTFAY